LTKKNNDAWSWQALHILESIQNLLKLLLALAVSRCGRLNMIIFQSRYKENRLINFVRYKKGTRKKRIGLSCEMHNKQNGNRFRSDRVTIDRRD